MNKNKKIEELTKANKGLKDKLDFKNNYIEELTKQIKEQNNHDCLRCVEGGSVVMSDMMQDFVNPEVEKLNDKIDMLQSGEDYKEIMSLIKGNISFAENCYKLGGYSICIDKAYDKKEKVIFNERIALRLYNMCETIYKFTEGE